MFTYIISIASLIQSISITIRLHFVFVLNDDFFAIDKLNLPEADVISQKQHNSSITTTTTSKFHVDPENALLRITSVETSENTSLNEMIDKYVTSTDPNDATLRHALSFLRKRKCLNDGNGNNDDGDGVGDSKNENIRIVMQKVMTPVYIELEGSVALRNALKGD